MPGFGDACYLCRISTLSFDSDDLSLLVSNRLKTVSPDKPLVVGSYAYLDGELHVRLSLAMDAIVRGLTESRSNVMVS